MDTLGVVDPLPDLGTGYFRSGGIFHEMVNGNTAVAAQPTGHVLNPHADVVAHRVGRE